MPGGDRGVRIFLLSCAGGVLAACLGACGSVGDPLPPLLNIPSPVQDLAASQVASEVHVQWTWPPLTTEGTVARHIGGFTLWAVDVPGFASALTRETIDEYRRPVATFGPPELAGKEPGDRVVFRSPLSNWRLGQLTILAVTAASRSGREAGYSNQARLHPLEPPAEPQWLEVSVVPSGVSLSWEAAERAEEYAVERALTEDGEFVSLGRLGIESFVDRTVGWGQSHSYRLRPYRLSEAGWIAGPASAESEVTPRDTFAPAAPRGLRAVRTPGVRRAVLAAECRIGPEGISRPPRRTGPVRTGAGNRVQRRTGRRKRGVRVRGDSHRCRRKRERAERIATRRRASGGDRLGQCPRVLRAAHSCSPSPWHPALPGRRSMKRAGCITGAGLA